MYEFQEYINQILAQIVNEITSSTGDFIGPAKIIAGIGALIAIYMVYKKSITDGDKINMHEIYRIGIILIAIVFYGTFIKMINLPLDLIENSIKAVAISETETTDDFFNSYRFGESISGEGVINNNEEFERRLGNQILEAENELGVWDRTKGVIGKAFEPFNSLMVGFQNAIWEALFNILHFLGVLAMILLNIIRSFFLIVLTYFGIFILAISVYPGLQNSFFQWLQKYINVYLWSAIAFIFQGLISKLFQFFQSTSLNNQNGDFDPIGYGEALANNMVVGLVSLASIIGFAIVPTISAWFINAATSSAGSKLKQNVAKIASAKATGGASLMK